MYSFEMIVKAGDLTSRRMGTPQVALRLGKSDSASSLGVLVTPRSSINWMCALLGRKMYLPNYQCAPQFSEVAPQLRPDPRGEALPALPGEGKIAYIERLFPRVSIASGAGNFCTSLNVFLTPDKEVLFTGKNARGVEFIVSDTYRRFLFNLHLLMEPQPRTDMLSAERPACYRGFDI